jgi:ABC-type transport system involved in multi-copper enzyme maturation permease subunit
MLRLFALFAAFHSVNSMIHKKTIRTVTLHPVHHLPASAAPS